MAGLSALGRAAQAQQLSWEGIQAKAKGQTVQFNAWGGDQRINDYIAWAAVEVKDPRTGKLTPSQVIVHRLIPVLIWQTEVDVFKHFGIEDR